MTASITSAARPTARKLPPEVNILLVLVGISIVFELLGWMLQGQSFLFNTQRLSIMILQVSVIGIIAIGVTQVIITGFTFLRLDAYYQEMIKGVIIGAAVVADVHRQKKRVRKS